MRDACGGHHPEPWSGSLNDFQSADTTMVRCLELAAAAARTDMPILITGESGTGKTLLARAIHNSSRRAHGAFVSFNGAALSLTLIDSQLFGHEKGAFTGADKCLKGKFELAHKGTLFIDEIADMSAEGQAKILRAVEYGEFERLGSEEILVADVRVIAATHLPLNLLTEDNRFRKDLLFRLKGITIHIPLLRERPSDLRSLIAAEISAAAEDQSKTITGLSRQAAEFLFTYAWPGNLRELKSVIHAAVAIAKGEIIQKEEVLVGLDENPLPDCSTAPDADEAAEQDLSLKTAEKRHILRVLRETGGNKRQAARLLGISRSRLDRKVAAIDSQ